MKHLYRLISAMLIASATALVVSCESGEPLNMECDITSISLDMSNPLDVFYAADNARKSIDEQTLTYTEDTITFICRTDCEIGAVPVTLSVTDGAVAYHYGEHGENAPFTNGTAVDFSNEQIQHFHIVSQDGAWFRDYFVRVVHRMVTGGDMTFTFEEYTLDPSNSYKFYIWPAVDENAVNGLFQGDPYWKNGNPGYKLSKSSAPADDYPTVPVPGGGPDGSDCIKMETKDTGGFGKMVGYLMAAGSLFNGSFDVANALKNARKATLFGSPFAHKPIRLNVDMRYEPAANYQDKNGVIHPELVDEPDAYIVVYKNTDENGKSVRLDGDDVLTNPYIVGIARMAHHVETDAQGVRHDIPGNNPIHGLTSEWKRFRYDVEYFEELDPERLANMGYSMVVGFCSSWQGGYFEGAIGSKLFIDNVFVECEE